MNEQGLRQALKALPLKKVAFFESVGSTNDEVAAWARTGQLPPALAAADEQTQGRGRSGRGWFTPPGAALAFSLLLAPSEGLDPAQLGRASALGGLAVCQALETAYGLTPEIKWPNDVLLGGKKVCGVLAEAHWQGERLAALILGIGINVAPSSLPPAAELNFPATSLEAVLGRPVDRLELLARVVETVLEWLPRLAAAPFVDAWQQRLAFVGQTVRLEGPTQRALEGELMGLAPDGSLRLQLADGSERQFQAGEIHLRPA